MITTSIIIIVKNDRGIKDTLFYLKKYITDINVETIVVDASDGELDNIRKQFEEVIWINYAGEKEKVTIPEQRNVGLNAARGRIIIFIDANCIPTPDWYRSLTQPIILGEQIVAGAVKPKNNRTVNNINNQTNNGGKYLKECPTINMAIKKTVFEKIGYFDENLQYGSDVDFSWRAADRGIKIYNAKSAIVYHDWGDFNDEIRRSFKYGVAKSIILRKHIRRAVHLDRYESITLVYPIYLALLPLTLVFPYYPLIIFIPILRNLKNNPFKLVFINVLYGLGFLKGIFFNNYKTQQV